MRVTLFAAAAIAVAFLPGTAPAEETVAPRSLVAAVTVPSDPLDGEWSGDYQGGRCSWHGDLLVKARHVTGAITLNGTLSYAVDTTLGEGQEIHQFLGATKYQSHRTTIQRMLDGQFPHLVITNTWGFCGVNLDLVPVQ